MTNPPPDDDEPDVFTKDNMKEVYEIMTYVLCVSLSCARLSLFPAFVLAQKSSRRGTGIFRSSIHSFEFSFRAFSSFSYFQTFRTLVYEPSYMLTRSTWTKTRMRTYPHIPKHTSVPTHTDQNTKANLPARTAHGWIHKSMGCNRKFTIMFCRAEIFFRAHTAHTLVA